MRDWGSHVRPRLSSLRLSPTREHEIVEELSQHLEDRWRELVAGGTPEDDATRLALAEFKEGNLLARYKRRCSRRRRRRPSPPRAGRTRSARFRARPAVCAANAAPPAGLRAVAFLAAAAFAVGIGAATSIYTVVSAVMLKPLPYGDGERFVAIFSAAVSDPEHYGSLSLRDAQTYQERTRVFDAFGWFRYAGQTLTFAGEPHRVEGVAVTPPLARQLGVDPILGQWFQDETGIVISAALWRRLGSDPAIVGKPLTLDRRSYTVTGVMPDYFQLPVDGILSAGARADVWIPLDPSRTRGTRGAGSISRAHGGGRT